MNEIGKYKIIRKVGTGGMATVYLVQDKLMQKYFAMKILHPQFTENKIIRQRFIQEARLQISLNHPNIIRCFDVDFQNEYYYILLEYVPGFALSDILAERQQPFPLDVNIAIFIQVLAAIEYAHRRNVIHRDIKPHNIIVANNSGDIRASDTIKIGDFGIAKAFGEDTHTRTGARLGTLQYMSPEQIVDSSKIDIRSDIYALGVTFYQLLTGKLPYKDTSNELTLMEAIVKERVVFPAQFKNRYPAWLSAVIEKAVEKEPQKRFQNCHDFLQAIQSGLNQNENSRPKIQPTLKSSGGRLPVKKNTTPAKVERPTTSGTKSTFYVTMGIIAGIVLILGMLFQIKDVFQAAPVMQNFRGQQIATVLDKLSGMGIHKVQIIKKISSDKKNGYVLNCLPVANTKLTNDSHIRLTVAFNPLSRSRFASYYTQGVNKFLKEKQIIIYRIHFFDTFDGKAKSWRPLDGNGNNYSIQQRDGHLFVVKKDGRGPLLIDYPGPALENFVIRTDIVKALSGDSPENGFYYMYHANMLNLIIDLQQKKYFAGFLKNGSWHGHWARARSIEQKYTNFLEMVVYKGSVFFFVNGKLMKEVNGELGLKNGRVGLMVNGLEKPVAFDNVVVCALL